MTSKMLYQPKHQRWLFQFLFPINVDVVLLVTTVVVAVDSVTLHGPSEGYLVSRTRT